MFDIGAQRFAEIQHRLGLSDAALGERLFRTPGPAGRVGALRQGRVPAAEDLSVAMLKLAARARATRNSDAPTWKIVLTASKPVRLLT